MARGNPGAILAMGIGTFLLALGWTGKYVQVWQALTGSPAAAAGTPATSDTGSNNGGTRTTYQVTRQDGSLATVDSMSVLVNPAGGTSPTCANGSELVSMKTSDSVVEKLYCVDSRLLHPINGGGQSLEGMGITIYPNGKKAYTRLPNAGYLHA